MKTNIKKSDEDIIYCELTLEMIKDYLKDFNSPKQLKEDEK